VRKSLSLRLQQTATEFSSLTVFCIGTEYTIRYIQAPDGYYVSEQPISIKFKKDENGKITVESFDGGFNTDTGKSETVNSISSALS